MINVLVEARVGFDQVKPWIGGSVEKDGRNPARKPTWNGVESLVNHGRNYQAQLVIAGFLNHQQ